MPEGTLSHQEIRVVKNHLDKPFIFNGQGVIGYDCCTLTKSILEEVFQVNIHEDYFGSHCLSLLKLNPTIVRDELDKLFSCIAPCFTFEKDGHQLQKFDILLFRILQYDSHLGVYLGDGKFISIVEQMSSDIFSLHSKTWGRRIVSVYRLEV